jgi:hypothetical protein
MYEANGRQFFVVNATSTIVGQDGASEQPSVPPPVRAYVAFALPEKGSAR